MNVRKLTDEDYEKQPHLVFKKGTKVRVTGIYASMVRSLEDFYIKYAGSKNSRTRRAAAEALEDRQAFIRAKGQTTTVVGYFIGANPHIVEIDGRQIGLPKECLEEVQ